MSGPHPTRPRRAADRFVVLVALVFLFTPAVAFAVGVRATSFENRRLTPLPEADSGWAFFTGLPAWATDHLPLRERAVHAADAISQHVFSDPLGTGPGVTTQDGYPAVVVGRDGYWYLGDDFRLKCETTVPLSMIVRQLNRLDDALRASGRTLIVVEAPDKSTMMPEHLPAETPGKACARARSAATRRAMHRVPAFLDLRPGLREAAADSPWPMYMPKDTHWDGPGAAEMVRQIVLRTDPAVAATFAPRDAGVSPRVADLATLLGRDDEEDFHIVTLAAPSVEPSKTALKEPSEVPQHVHAVGPPGTVVTTPTTLLGDSFTSASATVFAGTYADLTILNHRAAGLAPATTVDAIVSAQTVVLELVERDLAVGNSYVFQDAFVDAVSAAVAAAPRSP